MQGNKLLAILILGTMFVALFPGSGETSAQDVTPPMIVDATVATPVTGSNYTVQALVSDDSGISYVRLYNLYFKIPNGTNGITTPQIIPMSSNGSVYYATFWVPDNAIRLFYTISGNDTYNNWSITDVISRDVEDDKNPVANCSALVSLNLGGSWTFNGSGSTDNVQVGNYTWHLQSGTTSVYLYGSQPSHTFNSSGTYTGSLTVKDLWGNTGTANFQVNVLDTEPPDADAGIEVYVVAGYMAFLDGSASTDNEHIANYTWSYTANGTARFLYGVSPSITLWSSGTYTVTLTVTDNAGNTDTDTVSVVVLPGEGEEEEGGISWWVYALMLMVLIFVILAIIIVRM